MSRDVGRDIPGSEKLCARKLWADFSFPIVGCDLRFRKGLSAEKFNFQGPVVH